MKKIGLIISALVLTLTLSACGNSADETVNVYTRDVNSGTREAFMKGIDFGDAAEDDSLLVAGKTEVSGNSDMIAKIKADENGLGYISLSSLDGSGVTGLTFEGVEATVANVLNGTYGLKRPFMYMKRAEYTDANVGAIVDAMIAYMGTTDGLAIIENNGGIADAGTAVSWDSIKANYAVCATDTSALTVMVGGSTSVEKIAKAISEDFSAKCGGFTASHNHEGSSSAYKGVQAADTKDEAATYLDLGFASRDFKDSEAGAEGTFGQICWDAVVAVVNESNTVITNVTAEELKKLYSGEVTTWAGLEE
jgi:phosphate transport system substrate-binding protein